MGIARERHHLPVEEVGALAGDVGEGGRDRDALRAVAGGAQFGLRLDGSGVAGDRGCAAQVDVIRGGRRVMLRRLCGGRGVVFGRRFLPVCDSKRAPGARYTYCEETWVAIK